MRKRGMDASPIESYPAFSEERGRLIAAAYDQMKHDPSNPDVKRAYDAMIGETLDQYNALKGSGIDFRFIPEGMADPYAASPAMGYKDLVENGRLWVFPTDKASAHWTRMWRTIRFLRVLAALATCRMRQQTTHLGLCMMPLGILDRATLSSVAKARKERS